MDSAVSAMVEPAANVVAEHDKPETPRFFSFSQRIGRLRYFAYTLLAMAGCALLLVAIYLLALLLPLALGQLISKIAFILVKNVGIPLVVFTLTIRRLHDFNASGWWALTVLMPFVTLLFLFIPGSKSSNRFGPPPAPNNPALSFVSIVMPIALIGIYVSLYGGKGSLSGPLQNNAPGAMPAPHSPGLKPY